MNIKHWEKWYWGIAITADALILSWLFYEDWNEIGKYWFYDVKLPLIILFWITYFWVVCRLTIWLWKLSTEGTESKKENI